MAKNKKGQKDTDDQNAASSQAEEGIIMMPLWAKAAVGLSTVLWVGLTAVSGLGIHSGIKMVRQATNPAYIAKNIEKIAHFSNGIPLGFKPQWCASTADATIASVANEKDQTQFFLIAAKPQGEQQAETAKQLTAELASSGMNGISRPLKIKSSNSMQVGGETMEYVLGSSFDQDSDKTDSFLGSVVLKDKRAIAFYGMTPPKQGSTVMNFNMDACNQLLSSIKSF